MSKLLIAISSVVFTLAVTAANAQNKPQPGAAAAAQPAQAPKEHSISAAAEAVQIGETEFNYGVGKAPLGAGNGTRQDHRQISFAKKFSALPKVITAITMLDQDGAANTRIKTYAAQVNETGFELAVETWADSHVYNVTVSWIAIGN